MADQALQVFLQSYKRHSRPGQQETEAQRSARVQAWDALPPFEQAIASVIYRIDNQTGAADPNARVAFFAEVPQGWANDLYAALELQANAPEPLVESTHQEL